MGVGLGMFPLDVVNTEVEWVDRTWFVADVAVW